MRGTRTIGVAFVGCALAAAAETLNPALSAAQTLNPAVLGAAAAETLNPPSPAAATPPAAAQAVPESAAPDSATPEGGAVALRPFDGSLGAGLAEVRRLTEAEDVDAALAVADRLLAPDPAARVRAWLERRSGGFSERPLAWFDGSLAGPLRALGLDPGTSAERAEVHYARGVALRAAARAREAGEAYDLVRGLGGAARPDAVYELGHLALLRGEGWRSQIPELAPPGSQPPAAQAPPAQQPGGAAPGAAAPDEHDPLQEARRAYQNALEAFVERLRLDWRDADTRANVELVRRRLRELDELEQQRKEQEQEQKDQQQGDKQDQQKDPKQDQEQKDPQQQDPEQQDPQQKDPEQKDPQEGETDPPEPEPGEQPEEEPAPEEEQPPTPEPEEGQLTKEELQRLQQLLEQERQLGEEILKALRRSTRGRTARDW